MTRTDPKRLFLSELARELRWRPLTRRRLLKELAQHVDDGAAELRVTGLSPDAALREALRRVGDVETIVSSVRSVGARSGKAGRLRSPAWVAVGAMSLVTAWAAELPPASGAKTTISSAPHTVQRDAASNHPRYARHHSRGAPALRRVRELTQR